MNLFRAVFCESLRFPAVFCENLRLPNAVNFGGRNGRQKSAKICAGIIWLRLSLLVCPFSLPLNLVRVNFRRSLSTGDEMV